MQTFLPWICKRLLSQARSSKDLVDKVVLLYRVFYHCVEVLDRQRLGKQRVEAYQLIRQIQGITRNYRNHPAARMWEPYVEALKLYMNATVDAWTDRGYRNNMERYDIDLEALTIPPWLGNDRVHCSHRSNLVAKKPDYYGKVFDDNPGQPYVWPVPDDNEDGWKPYVAS